MRSIAVGGIRGRGRFMRAMGNSSASCCDSRSKRSSSVADLLILPSSDCSVRNNNQSHKTYAIAEFRSAPEYEIPFRSTSNHCSCTRSEYLQKKTHGAFWDGMGMRDGMRRHAPSLGSSVRVQRRERTPVAGSCARVDLQPPIRDHGWNAGERHWRGRLAIGDIWIVHDIREPLQRLV